MLLPGETMPQQSLLKGALLILSAEALLAMMAAVIKLLSSELPIEQIVFFRNVFGLVFLAPLLIKLGSNTDGNNWKSVLKTDHLRWHLLRAAAGLAAMYGFFYTISHLPLAEASIVKLTTPFFLPVIAFFWLGERLSRKTYWAIPVGFVGVLLIIKPGDQFSYAALVGLGAAALASVAKVAIRRMAHTEPTTRIVFYFATLCSIATLPAAVINWHAPSLHLWLWIVALGLLGTAGQLLMTRAYQVAKPGQVGPYVYSSVLYAAILGWFFWGELLSVSSVLGCLLIIGAGLFNLGNGNINKTSDSKSNSSGGLQALSPQQHFPGRQSNDRNGL